MSGNAPWFSARIQRLAEALDTAIQTLDYMGQGKVAEHLREALYDEPCACIDSRLRRTT